MVFLGCLCPACGRVFYLDFMCPGCGLKLAMALVCLLFAWSPSLWGLVLVVLYRPDASVPMF